MFRLFGKERAEAEARKTMKALDEAVNGPEHKKQWFISLHCDTCKHWMVADPAKNGRFICRVCKGVAQVHAELMPKGDK